MRGLGFYQKLDRAVDRSGSLLCVGLDPDFRKLPAGMGQFEFNRNIIDATASLVCAYKPNPAFYEARGAEGVKALKQTCDYLHEKHPDVVIIIDAKRGDIGNSNAGYVEYAFDYLGGDAVTVPPYMGAESLGAFLERADRGVLVLCRTSNPGAGEFQDLEVDGEELYLKVARQVAEAWNRQGNCGLVAGATYPEELSKLRDIVGGEMPVLVPGTGAQGGDLGGSLRAGLNERGRGLIINASRGVIFANDPKKAAEALHDEIGKHRKENKS
jgi:orotidine-5'-phosphate decarboxylase